jgi:hypothetical protein
LQAWRVGCEQEISASMDRPAARVSEIERFLEPSTFKTEQNIKMSTNAKIWAGPFEMDARKGRKVFYHFVKDGEREQTWEISFKAEGGCGSVSCGVRWVDHEGEVFGETGDYRFGSFNENDGSWCGTTKLELKNVRFLMVYLDGVFGFRDDFVKLYEQKRFQ